MLIWSAEIKELERLYESFKGQLPDLEKELVHLIGTDDENVALLYSRRCLEIIITDLCECELERPRGTEPLKGIIDKLNREKKVPSNIIASMLNLNTLSTFGTHPKDFDPEQVKPVLNNVGIILKWYLQRNNKQVEINLQREPGRYQDGPQSVSPPEKSIAVLPFINDSPDQENTYFINGVMEEILNNLQKIKDLRVISRTSVEQFRGSKIPISKIARELGVNYIVEGSGQKYGTSFRLRTQLILAEHESHVWGESFQKKINDVEDIFNIQIQIAESIATELKAVIVPEEKQLIEKIPTSNLTAYDLALQAQKFYFDFIFSIDKNILKLEKVRQLCKASLELDPGFAQAYYWLGMSSLSDKSASGYPLPFLLDTALGFFNKAIELDPTFAEAYADRGRYYLNKAQINKAVDDLNKSIRLSPNNSLSYYYLGHTYYLNRDYINALTNYKKAEQLTKSDATQGSILTMIWWIYISIGDLQKAKSYRNKFENFFSEYAHTMTFWIQDIQGKYEELLEESGKFITLHPEFADAYDYKARALLMLGRTQEAEDCIRIRIKYSAPQSNNAHRVGIVLWMNGKKDEAMDYFNLQIKNCTENIMLRNEYGQMTAVYDLASVYAFLGNKEEAFKLLREYEKSGFMAGTHEYLKVDPLFDSLRNDDEFKDIVKRANNKAAELRARINELEEQGRI